MTKIEHRNLTPLIDWFRDLARGRKFISSLRYADEIAKRTQPPPHIPDGPYHKTSKVYYYTRDARRLVQPPVVLNLEKLLESRKSDTTQKKLNETTKKIG